MSDLTTSASALVRINSVEIQPIVVREQRVLTLAQIDKVHGRPEGTAKRNFNENKSRLIEGQDWFRVSPDEIRLNNPGAITNANRSSLTVATESGYLLLVKSFTDDLAWQVQRELVSAYFRVQSTEKEAQSRGETPAIRDGTRFLAIVRDGRFLLEEISGDSFVLPASDWPKVIQTSNFPKDLLPELLEAVGARMKRLPGQAISPRLHTASNQAAREQVMQKVTEAKSKGISRRDLHMQCHAYRKLGRAKRLKLIQQMIENKDIFEMDVLNPKTKRKSRVLVASAFVKTEQGGQA